MRMAWLRQIFSHKWVRVLLAHVLGIGAVAAVVITLSLLFGSACPSYLIFGFCCPFCGMTRAHLAALRLDFASALYYHPAFFTGIPLLWLLFHEQLFVKKWQKILRWITIGVLIAVLLLTYVIRVLLFGFDFFA